VWSRQWNVVLKQQVIWSAQEISTVRGKKACNVGVRMTQVETNNGRPGWALHASYICDHVRRKCFGCGMTESSVTLPSLAAWSDDAILHLLQDRISLLTFILLFSFLYFRLYICLFISVSFDPHLALRYIHITAQGSYSHWLFREISVSLPRACVCGWVGLHRVK